MARRRSSCCGCPLTFRRPRLLLFPSERRLPVPRLAALQPPVAPPPLARRSRSPGRYRRPHWRPQGRRPRQELRGHDRWPPDRGRARPERVPLRWPPPPPPPGHAVVCAPWTRRGRRQPGPVRPEPGPQLGPQLEMEPPRPHERAAGCRVRHLPHPPHQPCGPHPPRPSEERAPRGRGWRGESAAGRRPREHGRCGAMRRPESVPSPRRRPGTAPVNVRATVRATVGAPSRCWCRPRRRPVPFPHSRCSPSWPRVHPPRHEPVREPCHCPASPSRTARPLPRPGRRRPAGRGSP